jgi:hypothetical protein
MCDVSCELYKYLMIACNALYLYEMMTGERELGLGLVVGWGVGIGIGMKQSWEDEDGEWGWGWGGEGATLLSFESERSFLLFLSKSQPTLGLISA